MLRVFLCSLIAGVGATGLGGVLCAVVGRRSDRSMSFVMSFAGGVMAAVACFGLFPEGLGLSNVALVAAAGLFGALALLLLSELLDGAKFRTFVKGENRLLRAGILLVVGIALHNIPEGLAIGAGDAAGRGIATALCIGLHNLPEGLAIGIPLKLSGVKNHKIIGLTLLSGLFTVAGAMIGYVVGLQAPYLVATCLSVAGGAMLFLSYGTLLSESLRLYRGNTAAVGGTVGILAGLAMMTLL